MAALGSRALTLRIGSTNYDDQVSDVRIATEEDDSDFVSFAAAAAGGARKYSLAMTMTQDTASTSLWYFIWANSGTTQTVEVWPNGRPGSGTATATQPKFTCSAVVSEPDGDLLGGEADKSTTARFLTEVSWELTAKPTFAIS
jgi:hypothetical protein